MTSPTRADGTPIEVLLVEDDPGDVLMTQEAFEEHKVRNRLTVVSDGSEALAYLRREGAYADAVRPDLILLDLNLPDIGGELVLQRLRAEPTTRSIPVIVISADATPGQIERLKASGAQDYMTKPFDIDTLLAAVDAVVPVAG
jgi:CheY-like chemotaxis protein